MWKDKRSGIYQAWVGNKKISLRTSNKKLASEREAKAKADFIDSTFGIRRKSRIQFYQLADAYIKSLRDDRNDCAKFERKIRGIKQRLEKHVYPEFAPTPVVQIRTIDVKKWAERLLVDHESDGVNRIVCIMRAIVKWGVANDLGIPFDPVQKWPRFEARQDKWTTLTASEIDDLFDTDHPEMVKIMPIVRMALYTGMRLSNVVLLKWDQIDLENGFIRIEADKMKGHRTLTIPLLEEATAVLNGQENTDETYVFTDTKGTPWHPNSVTRIWRNFKKYAGINRRVRFHDLRHTFASHLTMQGRKLEVVGEILGHNSPSTTKRYAHLSPEFLKESLRGFSFTPRRQNSDRNMPKDERKGKSMQVQREDKAH